ncbi:MAG: acyl carrier protein [Eubacteriales bacterium]|nr:acyl carrier protein [Eubacteriales bacterium]MDD3882115.1 acyl carrier protein [Eubacteriales bacterium]MDD4513220.1 acyl carrier protein [Eubacteriales bacterium]
MNFQDVAKILADYKDIDASQIKPESTFAELGLDSLDMAELVMNMEDELGVTIEMNESIKTVADIMSAIGAVA